MESISVSSSSITPTSITPSGDNKPFIIVILSALLVLSLLGINLFIVVGNIFQKILDIFKPLISQILAIFGYTAGTLINKSADVTSDVARAGVDIAEGTLQSVGNLLKDASKGSINMNTLTELDMVSSGPVADHAESSIQNTISSGKTTWCLVGEQNGRRGCVSVSDASKCMSGQVYGSREMCMNPTQTSNIPPKIPQHPLKSIKTH
jgi:hypothetical protein